MKQVCDERIEKDEAEGAVVEGCYDVKSGFIDNCITKILTNVNVSQEVLTRVGALLGG
jgi:hypothetical protein